LTAISRPEIARIGPCVLETGDDVVIVVLYRGFIMMEFGW
jgi:hypothetical protein